MVLCEKYLADLLLQFCSATYKYFFHETIQVLEFYFFEQQLVNLEGTI